MADNQLKYVIDGDASGLTNAVGQANKAITGMNKNLNSSKQVTNSFNQILRETPAFAFSAQTGILAISNNLPIFTDAITQARKNGESFGSILKGLGTSLFSVGSVLSIGTLALTLFSKDLFSAGESANDFKSNLKGVSDVISEATDSVQGDIAKIQALANVLNDANKPYRERQAALESLRKVNKAYFGDLSLEKSSYADVTNAVNGYTQALIQQAVIKGLQEEISQLAKQTREATKEYNNFAKLTVTAGEQLRKANEKALGESVKGLAATNGALVNAQTQYDSYKKKLVEAASKLQSLGGLNRELVAEIQKQVEEQAKIKPLDSQRLEDNKNIAKALKEQSRELLNIADLRAKINGAEKEVGKGPEIGNTVIKPRPIEGFTDKNATAEAEGIRNYYTTLEAAIEESNKIVKDGIVNGIIGIADAFGSALATGGIGDALAAAGESLLKIMGTVLQEVGKQMIIASELVQGLKIALKTLFTNPIAGVAVGVGLVALGGLLKNIQLAKVPAFAEGGIVSGPTLGLVGEAGREAIIPLDRIGEVLGSVGGAQSVFVTGQLSGETIYLQQQRTANRRGRFV